MKSNLRIIWVVLLSVLLAVSLSACSGGERGPLSPARNIIDTWKTPLPVEFYIATDFCTCDWGQSPYTCSFSEWNGYHDY
jgi:hypothetical protein